MAIQPYIFFDGCAEEAIAFYRKALGAEVHMLMRFNESPDPPPPGMVPPGMENKVMHATVQIGDGILHFSDGGACNGGHVKPQGFAVSHQVKDADTANRAFAALAEGGQITMPIGKTFFSERFGMLVDRFGLPWMVMVAPPM